MHSREIRDFKLNNFDEWATIYDDVYQNLNHDIPFYLQQAVISGGPILELGCGTGRISISLASQGFEVVGIDISGAMVEKAKEKALEQGPLPHLSFYEKDMRFLDFDRLFNLIIIPFRSLMLLDNAPDQQAALLQAAKHLKKNGRLVFDLFNPSPELLSDTDPSPFLVSDFQLTTERSIKVFASNEWDHENQHSMPNLWIEVFDNSGDLVSSYYQKLKMRYLFVEQTTQMLATAGLKVDATYGGFNGELLDNVSEDQAWVCTPDESLKN